DWSSDVCSSDLRPPRHDDGGAADQREHPDDARDSGVHFRRGRLYLVAETVTMRGLRSTIVLVVILGVVGGYAYYLSKKPAEETTSKQEKVFASVQADKIDEIRVKSEQGES